MSKELPPLDDEMDSGLSAGRVVPSVSKSRSAAIFEGVQGTIRDIPSHALAPRPPAADVSGWTRWWFGGAGLAIGLVVGSGAMWFALGGGPSFGEDGELVGAEAMTETSAPAEDNDDGVSDRDHQNRANHDTPSTEVVPLDRESGREREDSRVESESQARPSGVASVSPAERNEETDADAPRSITPQAAPRGSTLVSERRIVDAALAQVGRGFPVEALHDVERHERLFPEGQLVEARETVRIRALAALGRLDEARASFGQFRERFAGSPAVPALERLLARAPVR